MKKSTKSKDISRCGWTGADERMIAYHDHEWGFPVHDDKKHFEMMVLDSFQAGLSWKTILHRREGFHKAFSGFDVEKVAKYSDRQVEKLMNDTGIIRNKLKITGTIKNAKAFIAIQQEFGSFDAYIWRFTGNKTIVNKPAQLSELQATCAESDAMSKELKKRGFTFVGSTICYAYMQAAGMIDDHLITCFRKKKKG
jgi:DNA-3-methyladenine glycosylase I